MRRYEKDRNEMNGLVVNTAGVAVRSIAIDSKGKKVAVTSEYVGNYSSKGSTDAGYDIIVNIRSR